MKPTVVRDKDARDLLVKRLGLTVYRADTGRVEMYDGNPVSGWTDIEKRP